jgi:hypothetical protein
MYLFSCRHVNNFPQSHTHSYKLQTSQPTEGRTAARFNWRNENCAIYQIITNERIQILYDFTRLISLINPSSRLQEVAYGRQVLTLSGNTATHRNIVRTISLLQGAFVWVVTPYGSVRDSKHGGNKIFRNVVLSPNYTELQPTRQYFPSLPLENFKWNLSVGTATCLLPELVHVYRVQLHL